jgi:hypothetical protein
MMRLASANRNQAWGSSGPRDAMSVRSRIASNCSSPTPLDGGGGTQTIVTRYEWHSAVRLIDR